MPAPLREIFLYRPRGLPIFGCEQRCLWAKRCCRRPDPTAAGAGRRSADRGARVGVAAAVIEFITGSLTAAPRRVGKPLRRELAGLYSARRGTFRVLCRIDDAEHLVTVIRVEHPLTPIVGVDVLARAPNINICRTNVLSSCTPTLCSTISSASRRPSMSTMRFGIFST